MLYNSKTERLLLEKKIVFNSIHRHQLPIDFDKKKNSVHAHNSQLIQRTYSHQNKRISF
jgi:hypothetical protein